MAEQRLLTFTSGALFHDDDGRLTALRARLAAPPLDVRLYKLACQWRRIGEEQAFVGRTGSTGDEIGSRVIAARLVRDLMRMGFLIEDRYAPYPKWFGRAFAALANAPYGRCRPMLERALAAKRLEEAHRAALAEAYLALATLHKARDLPGAFELGHRGLFPDLTVHGHQRRNHLGGDPRPRDRQSGPARPARHRAAWIRSRTPRPWSRRSPTRGAP